MKADRKLYLTKDGQVVEQDFPKSKVLLVGTNGEITASDAKKYGLTLAEGKIVLPESEPAEESDDDDSDETEEAPKARGVSAKKASSSKTRKK